MSRLTGKGAGSLADAYASIYEAKKEEMKGGDCTAASEKSKHNCAKKVCHEEFGEGTCVHGQHSFPDENGFVSHYDVEFSHGIEKAVPVSEMKVLEEGSHPTAEEHEGMYEGEQLVENQANRLKQQQLRQQQNTNRAQQQLGGIVDALKAKPTGGVGDARREARGSSYRAPTSSTTTVKPPTTAPVEPAKPKLSAQDQKTNAEYDRLRKKNPTTGKVEGSASDLKKAADFGKAAAQAKFGDQKPKTPNPLLSRGGDDSISAMRKRSQERQNQSSRLDKALSGIKPVADDVDLFDLVKGHLIDEGATAEEAMQKMISMTQEEILTLAENRRAARAAGGYKDDSKKQTDPSKEGFTGISGSIKDIMRQNKEIEARNKKK